MQSISMFFGSLTTDINILRDKPNEDKDIRNSRMLSVATRILGVAIAAISLAAIASALVYATSVPLAATIGIIVIGGAIGVLAHDFIVVGNNLNKQNAALTAPQHMITRPLQAISDLWQGGKMIYGEFTKETPSSLHETILFERIYKLGNLNYQHLNKKD